MLLDACATSSYENSTGQATECGKPEIATVPQANMLCRQDIALAAMSRQFVESVVALL